MHLQIDQIATFYALFTVSFLLVLAPQWLQSGILETQEE
jgi:hypothetical protein